MSLIEFKASQIVEKYGFPFEALLMAAMRKAGVFDQMTLRKVYPELWEEMKERLASKDGTVEKERAAALRQKPPTPKN